MTVYRKRPGEPMTGSGAGLTFSFLRDAGFAFAVQIPRYPCRANLAIADQPFPGLENFKELALAPDPQIVCPFDRVQQGVKRFRQLK